MVSHEEEPEFEVPVLTLGQEPHSTVHGRTHVAQPLLRVLHLRREREGGGEGQKMRRGGEEGRGGERKRIENREERRRGRRGEGGEGGRGGGGGGGRGGGGGGGGGEGGRERRKEERRRRNRCNGLTLVTSASPHSFSIQGPQYTLRREVCVCVCVCVGGRREGHSINKINTLQSRAVKQSPHLLKMLP